MAELLEQVHAHVANVTVFGESHPILTVWGVRDEEVLVHSLGCSAWNSLGERLGFMAVCECPAPTAYSAGIRSDSVWFSRADRTPQVLIEFERYDGTDTSARKLEEKMRNLVDAANRWQLAPKLLVLSAWSKGLVSAPDTSVLVSTLRKGFKTTAGVDVSPLRNVSVLFNRMIFQTEAGGTLMLTHSLCERLQ